MTEKLVELLSKFLVSKEMIVLFISALPVSELRGAIPLAIAKYNFPPLKAYTIAVIGNMIPVIPIILMLEPIRKLLSKISFIKRFFDWLYERTYHKTRKNVMKYGAIGLSLFVAIPLPVTGAWTGSIAALIFDIKMKWALPAILLGVLMAGIIVITLTLLGVAFIHG